MQKIKNKITFHLVVYVPFFILSPMDSILWAVLIWQNYRLYSRSF